MNKARVARRTIQVFVAAVVLAGVLFVANALLADWGHPDSVVNPDVAPEGEVSEVRVLAFNIAKCFMYEGGLSFAESDEVVARLDQILDVISRTRPNLVFLSEVVLEGGPCPVNQVEYLFERGGFHAYAFGEEYNWGLPFWRIRSGNAILSRFPLKALENIQLAGGKPFFNPSNNRRTLWCELTINGQAIITGAIRNDSFDIENNLVQTREILAWLGDRTALLAGDFNAEPHTAPMQLLQSEKRFTARFAGSPTFPLPVPTRCIDYVLAPRGWRLKSHETIAASVSDHLPVLSVFSLQ